MLGGSLEVPREEEIIENPEQGTAGLTSARQIVDYTSVGYSPMETTSAPQPQMHHFPDRARLRTAELQSLPSRRQRFLEVLRASIRRNKEILEDLAGR